MSLIKNASPQIIFLGADDKSTRQVYPAPEPIPQHCPLFYIFAKKGPTDRQVLSPSKFTTVYGSETFDPNDKYFNHQTRYLRQLQTYGNVAMVQRLLPKDVGTRSNMTVYADIIEADIPNYKRNSDGSYVLDKDTGKPVVDNKTPTVKGYKVKYIKEFSSGTQKEELPLGSINSKTGTMVEYIDIPNPVYTNFTVSDIPERIKNGETAQLAIQGISKDDYDVTIEPAGIVAFDKEQRTLTASSVGNATIKFKTKKQNEEARELSFNISVIAENTPENASLTVSDIKNTLNNTITSATLTIDTNASDFDLVSSDPNIVTVDKARKSYTAIGNGLVTLTVSTKDSAKNNKSVTTTIVVKGYVPKHNMNLGIGQSKHIKLSNYHNIVSSTINPTGFFGIDVTTGALVGVKAGSGIISYRDRKDQVIETVTVTVKEGKQEIVAGESETSFDYGTPPEANDVIRSTMYPIFQRRAKYPGEAYNNNGFTIGTVFGSDVDTAIVSELKTLPYTLSLYTRASKSSSPTILRTLFGEPSMTFVFKEKAIHPTMENKIDFETIYNDNWYNETNELKTLRTWEDEGLYFYRDNFETITKMFLDKEKEYISAEPKTWNDNLEASTLSWFDFTTDDQTEILKENQLLNPFIAKSSKNANYFTLMLADNVSKLTENQGVVSIASDNPIFMDGGNDGTMTNEEFEKLVAEKMQDYANPDSEVMDLAINVESIFYDTGFSLETKKELVNFITLRKDTALVLSTHDNSLGEKYNNLSDTRSIAVALNNRLKLAPESEFYGTGVCRGIIVGGTGKLRDGTTNNRIPLHYEIFNKAANMMGSGDGIWDGTKLFDNYPGNTVDLLIDPQPSFIPAGIKPTLWSEGLVWAQPFDRTTWYFPALQTVYDNDTSVLNNFFVMMVLCNLNKVAYRVWAEFTGTSGMTDGEFIDAVTARANDLLRDKYAGMVTVIPFVTLTDEDIQRGYSWTMTFKLYGNNLRTVAVYTTEVYRTSDLEN